MIACYDTLYLGIPYSHTCNCMHRVRLLAHSIKIRLTVCTKQRMLLSLRSSALQAFACMAATQFYFVAGISHSNKLAYCLKLSLPHCRLIATRLYFVAGFSHCNELAVPEAFASLLIIVATRLNFAAGFSHRNELALPEALASSLLILDSYSALLCSRLFTYELAVPEALASSLLILGGYSALLCSRRFAHAVKALQFQAHTLPTPLLSTGLFTCR